MTAPAPTEAQLRATIAGMHDTARRNLRQIRSIAWLALAAMEARCADRTRESLADALESIQCTADLLIEELTDDADRAGCYRADEGRSRRADAQRRQAG